MSAFLLTAHLPSAIFTTVALAASPSINQDIENLPEVPVFPSTQYRILPITISQVLERVVKLSPEIRIQKRRLAVSYAIRDLAIEGFFPSFTVNGGTMAYNGEVQSSSGTFSNIQKQHTMIEQGGVLTTSPGISVESVPIGLFRVKKAGKFINSPCPSLHNPLRGCVRSK